VGPLRRLPRRCTPPPCGVPALAFFWKAGDPPGPRGERPTAPSLRRTGRQLESGNTRIDGHKRKAHRRRVWDFVPKAGREAMCENDSSQIDSSPLCGVRGPRRTTASSSNRRERPSSSAAPSACPGRPPFLLPFLGACHGENDAPCVVGTNCMKVLFGG